MRIFQIDCNLSESEPQTRPAWAAVDGECRAQYKRQPVLYHHGHYRPFRRQARGVWASGQRCGYPGNQLSVLSCATRHPIEYRMLLSRVGEGRARIGTRKRVVQLFMEIFFSMMRIGVFNSPVRVRLCNRVRSLGSGSHFT